MGLPSGPTTNQRLCIIIHNLSCKCLWTKAIGLERRWYRWELNLWLKYTCNPPLSQKQHTTSMHAFRSLMKGCLHDKYYLVACVASPHITQHSALSTEATTTFLMSVSQVNHLQVNLMNLLPIQMFSAPCTLWH